MAYHHWLPREVLGLTLSEFQFAMEGTADWIKASAPKQG